MDAVKPGRVRRSLSAGGLAASDGGAKKEKVWVAVRIRPLLELEQLARERSAWQAVGEDTLQHVDPERVGPTCPSYQYSRVFGETCSSQQVYREAAHGLVAATLRGYNSTIFAYGQTGSGKTYTMQALMATAAQNVFQLIAEQPGREFIIRVSAVEIYNEVVRDLLRDSSPALKLLDDPVRGTVADGLSEAGVQSVQHLQELLREVEARRQTRATRMNDSSSRSHEIVRLYIESRPAGSSSAGCEAEDETAAQDVQLPGTSGGGAADLPAAAAAALAAAAEQLSSVTTATISFVDLAGSERAAQAAEAGEKEKLRQKEASNINKSLLTLSSVIRALADNSGKRHIPYRDSKLTRLLQPSLSGNSHMVIITTISPAAGSAENTRAALHFATAAGRVVMRPQLNRLSSNKAVIKAMAAEIQQLKRQLEEMEAGQLEAALKQKEAEAAATAQERDALRKKLQLLQNQILRGDGEGHKLRASVDSQGCLWSNRAALARELRLSSLGVRASWACDGDFSRDSSRPGSASSGTSRQGSTFAAASRPELDPLAAGSPVRRSMRLLDCYLPRSGSGTSDASSSHSCGGQQQQQQQQQQLQALSKQQQQQQSRLTLQRQQQQSRAPSVPSILQQTTQPDAAQAADTRGHSQQQQQSKLQQQAAGSRLNPAKLKPEESSRALQIQKLQEPCGPEAEAAMAGLEVEVRCYKHVQEYTLAELSAALQHLEGQAAAGESLGSWSSDQLEALKSEVARKKAAEALTQLGDRALDALTRKVNSYTSSAEGSTIADLKRQLMDFSSGGGGGSVLDTPSVAAALACAAAAGMQQPQQWQQVSDPADGASSPELPCCDDGDSSWTEAGPQLMSGRVTPLQSKRAGMRASALPAGHAAPAAPDSASLAGSKAAGSRQQHQQQANELSAEDSAGSLGGPERSAHSGGAAAASPLVLQDGAAAAAAVVAQEQLLRMQEAWRESVEKDVSCLREVLGQYKERVERLEMQKKLLLSQVLKLEFALEEEEGQVLEAQQHLQQVQQERDAARAGSSSAAAAAAACSSGVPPAGGSCNAAAAAAAGCLSAAAAASPCGEAAAAAHGPHSLLPALNTSPLTGPNGASGFDACSDDGWASTPTVDSLLPKIVALWEELYVPLAYRSRFFLSFRGREMFYYEIEARRLEWKRSQMLLGATEEPSLAGPWAEQQPQQPQQQQGLGRTSYAGSTMEGGAAAAAPPGTPRARGSSTPRPMTSASAAAALTASSSFGGMRRRSKELDRAARALDWERKSLAAGLKWNLTETEREELYRAWGVDPDTKERKLQLVFKLWSKETLQQPDGMTRSSELVLLLCGMDAGEHMMELVFGSHLREYAGGGHPLGRGNSSGLGFAVSTIVRRLAPPLARTGGMAGGGGGSPLRSSYGAGGHAGVSAMTGALGSAYTPSRAGGSFTSRLQSGFLSLLSSRDRPLGAAPGTAVGLTSAHVGGSGPAVQGAQSREGSFSSMASSQCYRGRH